jgi:hypothetical protein
LLLARSSSLASQSKKTCHRAGIDFPNNSNRSDVEEACNDNYSFLDRRGIRGIGSLYYLSYVLNHGVTNVDAEPLVGLVVTVIASSIVIHGITVTPALQWYERSLARRSP